MVVTPYILRDSLLVQWLGFYPFTAKGMGSIPGWRTKFPQVAWNGQKQKWPKMAENNHMLIKKHSLAGPPWWSSG